MDVIVHENYIQREQEILYYIILAFHAVEILLNQGKLIAGCISIRETQSVLNFSFRSKQPETKDCGRRCTEQ